MPFAIVRNDITNMAVDAIVNTANPQSIVGAGVDAMIHEKAGPELLVARKAIGKISVGSAAVTPGYQLPARFVIHTVGPVWRGGLFGEEKKLRSCYDSALALAVEKGCKSIAFPLISAGHYGFPKDKALQVAIAAFSAFLTRQDMQIYLVVFNRDAYRLSEKLFSHVESYIAQHYVDACEKASFAMERNRQRPLVRESMAQATVQSLRPCAAPSAVSLADMLKMEDAGFTQTLLRLIDESGKKDAQIYKKANLSKQHFSKIRNNPQYKPTKSTALALAIALELDLEKTRDLIGRAGYALSRSSKFDLIIQYFIENRNYDIVQINMALYEFDQPLLGVGG